MSKPTIPPAHFVRICAELLPELVRVGELNFRVGRLNAPRTTGWLSGDLLAARNIASAHLGMAWDLLDLVAGHPPGEFERLLAWKEDGYCSKVHCLVCEIICQNGAEVITALFEQFTAANRQLAKCGLSEYPVKAGPIVEPNAHAAAFAATKQLANEVRHGVPLSIDAANLDRLQILIDREASLAEQRRERDLVAPAPTTRGQGKPRLTVEMEQSALTLDDTQYAVGSELALRWIQVLLSNPGAWISAKHLLQADPELTGVRTDRLKPFLPEPVKGLIESATGKGSRVNL